MKDEDAQTEAKLVKPRPLAIPAPTTIFSLEVSAMPTLQLAAVDKKLVEKIVERMKEL